MQKFLIGSVALSGLLAGGAMAAEKIVVVTSFPEDMTSVIEKAFEGAHLAGLEPDGVALDFGGDGDFLGDLKRCFEKLV